MRLPIGIAMLLQQLAQLYCSLKQSFSLVRRTAVGVGGDGVLGADWEDVALA